MVEQLANSEPGLSTHPQDVGGLAADDMCEFLRVTLWLRGRQVDLVQHRNDVQVALDRQVEVGQRLGLDPLCRIDQQHRALARGKRPGHLIREVDVAWRVDHVQHVADAVDLPGQPDCLALDRDAALALDIHAVEVLGTHRRARRPRP